jgi:hypothetical protein
MNGAHLHLVLNHLPIMGTMIGFLVLAAATVLRNGGAKKAGLGVLVLAAAGGVPTYLSGEPAEEIVETLSHVHESFVHEHEEWGLRGLIMSLITGVIALAGLVFYRGSRDIPRAWTLVTLVVALASSGILAWTGVLGGRIHHEETHPGFTTVGDPESDH